MPEVTRGTNRSARVSIPVDGRGSKAGSGRCPRECRGAPPPRSHNQRQKPFIKLVQSASLQQTPASSGWLGQAARHRIANGAGWQSVSAAHAFVQYWLPDPAHCPGASELLQIASTLAPVVKQISAQGCMQSLPSTDGADPQPVPAPNAPRNPSTAIVDDLTRTAHRIGSATGYNYNG
jgi:hypothetical protein